MGVIISDKSFVQYQAAILATSWPSLQLYVRRRATLGMVQTMPLIAAT